MNPIHYKKGYKYQLVEDYTQRIEELTQDFSTDYIAIANRVLVVKKGYAWDGPSGPTIDTKSFMRGSLIHDAMYQLLREGYLPASMRKIADKILARSCIEDGMPAVFAYIVYFAVRLFARYAADPSARKRAITAP